MILCCSTKLAKHFIHDFLFVQIHGSDVFLEQISFPKNKHKKKTKQCTVTFLDRDTYRIDLR